MFKLNQINLLNHKNLIINNLNNHKKSNKKKF